MKKPLTYILLAITSLYSSLLSADFIKFYWKGPNLINPPAEFVKIVNDLYYVKFQTLSEASSTEYLGAESFGKILEADVLQISRNRTVRGVRTDKCKYFEVQSYNPTEFRYEYTTIADCYSPVKGTYGNFLTVKSSALYQYDIVSVLRPGTYIRSDGKFGICSPDRTLLTTDILISIEVYVECVKR